MSRDGTGTLVALLCLGEKAGGREGRKECREIGGEGGREEGREEGSVVLPGVSSPFFGFSLTTTGAAATKSASKSSV